MADRIEIKNLQVVARVGVPDLERSIPQRLEIDMTISGDFRHLGDDLACTTDYAAACAWVRGECAQREFRLVESLADHLAAGFLANFPATESVTLELRKFIVPGTQHIAVRMTRTRA